MSRRMRRISLAAVLLLLPLAGCTAGDTGQTPLCTNIDDSVFVLLAQSVPSATQLPCVSDFPAGWSFGGSNISSGLGRFWLDSDRGGIHAVEVSLRSSCDTTDAIEERPAPDEAATRVFVRPDSLNPSFTGVRFLRFDGRLHRTTRSASRAAPRRRSRSRPSRRSRCSPAPRSSPRCRTSRGSPLCGAGAPPCAG